MTIKRISGTYSAGYTLNGYHTLQITSTGRIDGSGLLAPAPALVRNAGTIEATYQSAVGVDLASGGQLINFRAGVIGGGAGATGATNYKQYGVGGAGGAGGLGVSVTAGGILNEGQIVGGAGGASGSGHTAFDVGGEGGVGAALTGGAGLNNQGTITGGAGGLGDPLSPPGSGGAGVALAGAGSVTNTGTIAGGAGGASGRSGLKQGIGGAGIDLLSIGGSITNAGLLAGGAGGVGADDYDAGDGGTGGAGFSAAAVTAFDNTATAEGGAGGAGGNSLLFMHDYGKGGQGGVGGLGVLLLDGGMVTNTGNADGGLGGQGGYGYSSAGTGGHGGLGIGLGGGASLVNGGSAIGGLGGAGGASGDLGPTKGGGLGGAGGSGVRLDIGGDIVNTGTALGGQGGAGHYDVYAGGAGGAGGAGVFLVEGGTLVNRGLIEGAAGGAGGLNRQGQSGAAGAAGAGVYAGDGPATVTNAGTIAGPVDSVVFASASDILIADAGAQFVGAIVGGGGTLVLAGGTGVVSGLGGAGQVSGSDSATFSGFGSYVIGGGGHWSLSGTNVLEAGQSLTVNGTLTVGVGVGLGDAAGSVITIGSAGALRFQSVAPTLAGAIVNNGLLVEGESTVTVTGTMSGSGAVTIEDGSVAVATAFSENVAFAGRGTLGLALSQDYSGAISGFDASDGLDLGDIAFVNAGEATFSGNTSGGVLTVNDGTHSASIRLVGDYLGDSFTAASDGHGGVDISATAGGARSTHAPSTHAFVAAMAGLGAAGAAPPVLADVHAPDRPMLFSPRDPRV